MIIGIEGREFHSEAAVREWLESRRTDAPAWEQSHLCVLLEWYSGAEHFHFQTSGSTGEPKEMAFTRAQIAASSVMTARALHCGPGSRALLVLPSAYVAGKMMLLRAAVNGWHLRWEEPSSLPFGGELPEAGLVSLTPHQASGLLGRNILALDHVRVVLVGGAPVGNALHAQIRRTAAAVYETYGMTETLTHVALRRLNGPEEQDCFAPLPGVKAACGADGCLVIAAEHLGGSPVQTRDIAEIGEDGAFRILGRADNLINTGGIKVYPEQVEQKLAGITGRPFYVTGAPDASLGQAVTLVLEGGPLSDQERAHLEREIRERLGAYERPRRMVTEGGFEYTASGKIIRKHITH
jgi:o-succinylbenzoate---CoA ligase